MSRNMFKARSVCCLFFVDINKYASSISILYELVDVVLNSLINFSAVDIAVEEPFSCLLEANEIWDEGRKRKLKLIKKRK